MNAVPQPQRVDSITAKFLIGFLAGLALAMVPRLTSYLATSGRGPIEAFSVDYLIAGGALGALLGTMIAIFEYKLPRSPKDTFFAALAIPGLLIGAANSANQSISDASQRDKTFEQIEQVLEEQSISVQQTSAVKRISLNPASSGDMAAVPSLSFISVAHAEDPDTMLQQKAESSRTLDSLAIDYDPPRYYVQVGEADSIEAVVEETRRIHDEYAESLADAIPIETGDGRFVIISDQYLRGKFDAANEALNIKKSTGLQPELLEIADEE